MRRKLLAMLTVAVACAGAADITLARVAVTDAVVRYAQSGTVKQNDVHGKKLVIDGTAYLVLSNAQFRSQDGSVGSISALKPGMRIGFNTVDDAARGKEHITEIWLLDAGPASAAAKQ
jgi:hypothetical protein